jgi:protein involved in polysaccharide export with SLBB domain
VDPGTYVLGPGDRLSLEIRGAFSLSTLAEVAADGSITFPQLGTLDVAGRTLAEARDVVLGRGRELVRDSELDLVLSRTRVFKVYVVGEVLRPGPVRANPTMRVSEAVIAAGGVTEDGDLRNLRLLPRDGDAVPVDLAPFFLAGSLDSNPTLLDGATVLVPPRTARLEAYGAVLHRGSFPFVPGDRLARVLPLVGVSPLADSSEVVVQRFPPHDDWHTETLDLRAVLAGKADLALMPFDRILVRFREDWRPEEAVRVQGAVRRAGPVPVRRGEMRVADVLELAGGPTGDAVLQRVTLSRPSESDTLQVIDPTSTRGFLERLTNQEMHEDVVDLTAGPGPLVAPGDVISVPRDGGLVQVMGQVKVPGFYDHVADWRPRDYIDAAGGWAKQADKSQTRVTRGARGQVVFADDLERVAPGDLIWVPEKPKGDFWGTVRDVTTLVISFATLYLLIDQAGK